MKSKDLPQMKCSAPHLTGKQTQIGWSEKIIAVDGSFITASIRPEPMIRQALAVLFIDVDCTR